MKQSDRGTYQKDSVMQQFYRSCLGKVIILAVVSSLLLLIARLTVPGKEYMLGETTDNIRQCIEANINIPADKIAEEFIRISEEGKYHPDFYEARKIGVTSFPTLFLEINGKHYDLKGSAITLNDLEENLNIIKEKGGILNDGYNTPVACNIDGTGCS